MTMCIDLFGFTKSSYSAIALRNVFYQHVATHQESLDMHRLVKGW